MNTNGRFLRITARAFLLLMALAVNHSFVSAQCAGGIQRARYKEGTRVISVSLGNRLDQKDLDNGGQPSQWLLDDLSFSPSVTINIKDVRADTPVNGTFVTVTLFLNTPIDATHVYRLQAPFLTFEGCVPKDEDKPVALLTIKKNAVPPPPGETTEKPGTNFFPMSASQGREDSNVYISGQLEGANGSKPQFSADLKFDVPFLINVGPKPALGSPSQRKVIGIGPYFNLKASTSSDADADSLSFGGKVAIPFNVSKENHPGLHKVLTSVQWRPAFGFEADRRFDNVNTIFTNTFNFIVPGNRHTFKRRIRFLPFIGFELGRNLKSPVEEAEDRGIARGLIGGSLYINFDQSEDKTVSFQVDYVRRFLLRREVTFTEDDDKKLVPLVIGKGPRDYLKTTFEYDFSKFTGFTLSYEYGRLPPNYELVDHKYSLGLVFKFSSVFNPK